MFVHSSRIRKQFEYLQSLGVNPETLSRICDISIDETLDPEKTFSLDQFIEILEYALEYTGDEFYGLKFGADPYIGGTVGMMSASCKNLKEAFTLGCKYFRVQGDFMNIKFVDDPVYPKIRYSLASAWILKSPETAKQEVEAMFSFLVTILKVNSNQTLLPHMINLVSRKPFHAKIYQDILGVVPQFEQEYNEIFFLGKDLMLPMKAFNPETFQLLRSHIEEQLNKSSGNARISDKVRNILLSSLRYSFPDIETVASKLNMSPRTLQRQLSSEKTSYMALLQDTRSNLARQLLSKRDLSISEISFMLGYSDIGNFSRSFKKITGLSPQEFRQNSC